MDLGWVERRVVAGVEDGDLAAARRGREVTRERGDAAASRWVGGDEGCSNDERAPLEESLRAVGGEIGAPSARCDGGGCRAGRLGEPAGLAVERELGRVDLCCAWALGALLDLERDLLTADEAIEVK